MLKAEYPDLTNSEARCAPESSAVVVTAAISVTTAASVLIGGDVNAELS